MRIGVDAACLANERGYGRFARELLRAMVDLDDGHEYVLFADARAVSHVAALVGPAHAARVRVVMVAQSASPTVAAAADGSRAPRDMLRFTRAVWREPLDVFFSPSVYTYFPLPPGLPAVVTVHDAIAERHPGLTLPSRRARLFWSAKTRLALAQSRLVLTVSAYAAREIADVHHLAPTRIRIAVEAPAAAYQPSAAADVAAAAARAGLPAEARWFAYVGGFNPHKHVDVLVRAHAAVVAATPPDERAPHLLLVGPTAGDVFHGDGASIRRAIEAAGTQRLVHWAGFVPDEELRHLLTGAVALVLASECEGFGLPAVEAAACGAPVIATIASPLPELLAGGGHFVAPRDEGALVLAMRGLLGDEPARRAMGDVARTRAGLLSWPGAARATLDALAEAAA